MKRTTKQFAATCTLLLMAIPASWAQGPHNTGSYYQKADGQTGAALKTALCEIIYPHTQRTYAQLWTDFGSTDLREDGKIWDMYSGVTNYTLGTDQNKGSAKKEGDNYNREHSMPKSWFNDDYPMYTDLFHLYPTDSYVNAKRGNEPFGETDNPTYKSEGNFSKLGPGAARTGYTGIVFEPGDAYKGDFARTYFYMVTCYESYKDAKGNAKRVSSWKSAMLAQNVYPVFTDWAIRLLLQWSAQDPVSEKELNRNEAVYQIQGNRNPFIDYPGLEQYIWGDKTGMPFSYDSNDTGIRETGTTEADTDAPVYQLDGRRADNRHLRKGLYIRRGRKVLVK